MRLLLSLLAWLMAALPARAQPDPELLCRAAIARAERDGGIPAGLLQAIAQVESGRRNPQTGRFGPWPWTLNVEGRGHFLPSKAAAIAAVREQQAGGVRSIDVGCMQVNLRHHPNAFASLEEALDPEANARYAARFLRELHAARPDWMVAAGHYHSHTPEFATPYRARVQAAWNRAAPRAGEDQALLAAAAPAPVAAPPRGTPGNGAERAQMLPLAGAPGRGLDAYRAQPVPLAARAMLARLAPPPGAR